MNLSNLADEIERLPAHNFYGKVVSVKGLLVGCTGLEKVTSIGSRCKIITRSGVEVPAEVIGMRDNTTLFMPFKDLEGIGVGCPALLIEADSGVYPCDDWRGRVINALGEPIDSKGVLPRGTKSYPLRGTPIQSHA